MASPPAPASAVPAQLGFLAIFNPSLGASDAAAADQIVYWASRAPADAHERLRQIGLAQALASFARGFAAGAPADAVDSLRARAVALELEPGWWILASVDLARVPLPPRLDGRGRRCDFSARDVKPPALLRRDLVRAHRLFLLHHGASLAALLARWRRPRLAARLARYWDLFAATWSVALRGNPARDAWAAINVAASGELGVGVGEELRGSGERDVLEGFVARVDGLVDLVVSRFGPDDDAAATAARPWLGSGREPAPDDGAVFLGCGALSRPSLRDLTHWVEDLYTWGEHAYGIVETPATRPSARRAKPPDPRPEPAPHTKAAADEGRLDKVLSYMKLGYRSYWSSPGGSADSSSSGPPAPAPSDEPAGHYLVGLVGDMDDDDAAAASDSDGRTVRRTVHVELAPDGPREPLRAVVYANQPFLFVFLFRPHTPALASGALYRALHCQLAPLRRPLLASTGYRAPSAAAAAAGIYSLVWDPAALALRCSVPGIPDADAAPWSRADALSTHLHLLSLHAAARPRDAERSLKTSRGWWIVWTRVPDRRPDDPPARLATIRESSPPAASDASTEPDADDGEAPPVAKEIVLVRRASDHAGLLGSGGGGADGAGRLAQGIGVDTRRYVEELLSLL